MKYRYSYKLFSKLLFIILILIIIFFLFKLLKPKIIENFEWSKNKTNDFLLIQDTINKHKIFDVDYIQKYQASEKDLDYFLQNGYWYWNDDVIQLYKDAINSNPYVRVNPDDSVNYARTLYNQNAILKLLFFQSKEGDFLVNGIEIPPNNSNTNLQQLPSGFGDFGYKSGLMTNKNSIIKCNLDDFNNSYLERIDFKGNGGIFGEQLRETNKVKPEQLENLISGFKFLNGIPCNPCDLLKDKPNYSCGFILPSVSNQSQQPTKLMKYLTNY